MTAIAALTSSAGRTGSPQSGPLGRVAPAAFPPPERRAEQPRLAADAVRAQSWPRRRATAAPGTAGHGVAALIRSRSGAGAPRNSRSTIVELAPEPADLRAV